MWPPSLSRTAFSLLGMEFTRASQVATGMLFHSSMTASRSWQIFETLHTTFRLRIPQRCSIEFRIHAWPALPSASSVKQWSSQKCVWSHCHAGTLLCYPVSGGRGLCSAAVFHSSCWSSCFPQWNITLSNTCSTHAALDHDIPTTMLDCRHDTLIFVLLT